MRKLWALIRLDLQILLNAMHAGSTKRPWAAWVLMAVPGALMAYLGTLMGWSLATVMAPVGVLDLLAPLLAVLCAAMNLVFTLFAARGLVFTGRDSDLMLSLPVPTLWVVLGKLLALMLENLLLTVLWMVPAGVAAALSGGGAAICWPTYLASLPALALLPTTLGLAGGWLLALASARVRRQALVGNLLSMALMIAVLAASMQVNRLAALMLENAGSVRALLHGWLLPAGLFGSAAAGSWPAAAGFWAICLGLFLLVSVLVSRQYQRILAGLAGRNVRADYRLSALKASGQFRALYQKEWARYTHSNIWLMNTAVGPVLAVGGCVWFAFSAEGRILAAQMGPEAAWAGAALAGVVLSMCCTTCSSISLEGKNVWILQEAPLWCQGRTEPDTEYTGRFSVHRPAGLGLRAFCRANSGYGLCADVLGAVDGTVRFGREPAASQTGQPQRHCSGQAVGRFHGRYFRQRGLCRSGVRRRLAGPQPGADCLRMGCIRRALPWVLRPVALAVHGGYGPFRAVIKTAFSPKIRLSACLCAPGALY